MSDDLSNSSSRGLTSTQWLICIMAAIGFAFDTYELLMFPVIGSDAVAELLSTADNRVSPQSDIVRLWAGRMLWIAALSGGVFGLLGVGTQEGMAQSQKAVVGALGSFARLTDPARLTVQPQRIEVVRLPREMSFAEFLSSYPSSAQRDTLALVNGVSNDAAVLPAGRPMKRLVGGVKSAKP